MNSLMFLHGMESSPKGTKAQFIKAHFPDCIIPDLPPDINLRKPIIKNLIKSPIRLVGSSLGGLSAILYAMQNPGLVKGMLLISPAVGFFDKSVFSEKDQEIISQTYIPERIPTTIMIAKQDDVIPQADIEAMIERSPDKSLIQAVYRDDDHAQNQSLDHMLSEINKMMSTS